MKFIKLVVLFYVCSLITSCVSKQLGDTWEIERRYKYANIPGTACAIKFPHEWVLMNTPLNIHAADVVFCDSRIISTVYRGWETGDRAVSTIDLYVVCCSFDKYVQTVNDAWARTSLPISNEQRNEMLRNGYLFGIEPNMNFIKTNHFGNWFLKNRILIHTVSPDLTIAIVVSTKKNFPELIMHADLVFEDISSSVRKLE